MIEVQVLLGVAGYTMICFMFNMLDELTPIFAAAPISRGGMPCPATTCSKVLLYYRYACRGKQRALYWLGLRSGRITYCMLVHITGILSVCGCSQRPGSEL